MGATLWPSFVAKDEDAMFVVHRLRALSLTFLNLWMRFKLLAMP
jgi:hypothetical protein